MNSNHFVIGGFPRLPRFACAALRSALSSSASLRSNGRRSPSPCACYTADAFGEMFEPMPTKGGL